LRVYSSEGSIAGGQLTILDVFGVSHARFDAQVVASILEEEVDLVKGETRSFAPLIKTVCHLPPAIGGLSDVFCYTYKFNKKENFNVRLQPHCWLIRLSH
jgi:hypothetical protein